ncbi:molybdopterin molybdenumtransferase MoeA [Helicobacter anseris]|uniref:Molybdopterin molybdenumtransferase n=1 Tax=Helicobacter anseris TaxID=375926 RepID=A0A3D8J664_9HELI|nr:molybdopterin molybdotransferase MoeA [Helicobacter anseris]RDU72997.1 molybdopterin molybdenumtransferase MoeA [Helicobacter anseris]
MISLQEALDINFNLPKLTLDTQEIDIFEAQGYILAQDIYIKRALPMFDNSAMDGYAINLAYKNPKVTRTILAGQDASNITLQDNEAIRIMTGAMLPKNANAIAPFEITSLQDGILSIQKELHQGANIRKKGEEKQEGMLLAKKGQVLDFRDIGLLASQGYNKICVYQKPLIGVFSSGDEIKEVGEDALSHQIYNINAPSICAILKQYNHHYQYLGILKDNESLEEKILTASKKYQILITSGGASVGDADLLEKILLKHQANIYYHKINLKPGKPIMVAKLNQCYFFCLPGNPLSAILNLLALVIPTLQRLCNANAFYPLMLKAKCQEELNFKNNRSNIILGNYHRGIFTPHKNGKYSPSAISVFQECNSFAIFDEKFTQIHKNQEIDILLYMMSFTTK